MYAHKIKVVAEPSTDIVVRLPPDFPAGTAEVIILSEARVRPPMKVEAHERPNARRLALLQALAQRFPPDPALGPVLFHEDPNAPLDEDDWPAELRP
jgi:hypothetical protein